MGSMKWSVDCVFFSSALIARLYRIPHLPVQQACVSQVSQFPLTPPNTQTRVVCFCCCCSLAESRDSGFSLVGVLRVRCSSFLSRGCAQSWTLGPFRWGYARAFAKFVVRWCVVVLRLVASSLFGPVCLLRCVVVVVCVLIHTRQRISRPRTHHLSLGRRSLSHPSTAYTNKNQQTKIPISDATHTHTLAQKKRVTERNSSQTENDSELFSLISGFVSVNTFSVRTDLRDRGTA